MTPETDFWLPHACAGAFTQTQSSQAALRRQRLVDLRVQGLVYTASSKTARATQRNLVSQNKKPQNKKKKKHVEWKKKIIK